MKSRFIKDGDTYDRQKSLCWSLRSIRYTFVGRKRKVSSRLYPEGEATVVRYIESK